MRRRSSLDNPVGSWKMIRCECMGPLSQRNRGWESYIVRSKVRDQGRNQVKDQVWGQVQGQETRF